MTYVHAYWNNIRAIDSTGDVAIAWGSQWYNNVTDFTVLGWLGIRYSGVVHREHYLGGATINDGYSFGTIACTSQALATQFQEGEAELE